MHLKKRKIKYAAIFFLCWFGLMVLLVDGVWGFQTLVDYFGSYMFVEVALLLLVTLPTLAVYIAVPVIVAKKPKRIMREGKLLRSEMVYRDGEKFYVEKVGFKDWHVSIHSYYLISDRLMEGHTVVEQRWSYEDFCNVSFRLEDYTCALVRQVEAIALVRSFRPIPIDEFDRIALPLIM